MLSRTWLFLELIMLLSGCKSSVNDPPLNPPVELPEYVVGMQGPWRFDAAFDLRYNSQTFTCDIVNATIDVSPVLLGVSGTWYSISGIAKGAELRCSQDSVEKWEVPIDSLNIVIWRTQSQLRISFVVQTPFGPMGLDCYGEYKAEPNEDTWGGLIDADIYPWGIVQDGEGTWTLSRQR